MKRLVFGIIISIVVAFLTAKLVDLYIFLEEKPKLKKIEDQVVKRPITKSFNIAEKTVVKKTVDSTAALNDWILNATVLGNKPYALMLNGKDSEVLSIGEDLEGYELSKIEKTRVLFKIEGNDQWVYMKKYAPKNVINATKEQRLRNNYRIPTRAFQKALQNPDYLVRDINIGPNFVKNKLEGFKVFSLRKRSFLYTYGLRKDDIITEINGKKLTSVADAMNEYQKVLNLKNFTLKIIRDDEERTIKYAIR